MTSSPWLRTTLLLAASGFATCACAPDAPAPEPPPASALPSAPIPPPPAWARVSPEQHAAAREHGVPVAFENGIGMRFVLVPAGTFQMGVPPGEDRYPDEERQHEVTIPRPFYVQTTETSVAQFRALAEPSIEKQPAGAYPVGVTRSEALAFAEQLSKEDPGRTYRLPSETEWEYACRAGTVTLYAFGDWISPDQASYTLVMRNPDFQAKSSSPLAEVGHYPPNAWSLHEMHGNRAEWTGDAYAGGDIPSSEKSPWDGHGRAWIPIRGGGRLSPEHEVRSTARNLWPTDLPVGAGFRLVSPLSRSSP